MASVSWPIAPTTHGRSLFTNDDVLAGDRPTPNINLSVIPPLSVPVPVPARHTGEGFDPGQNLGVSSTPAWISLIKPLPPTVERVITLRRDSHFALEIILDHLPREPPEGWDGVKVPATASVKNCADTTGKTLLEFRVHLYGATTNQRYEVACESCQKREGKRRGIPSLVDFKAEYDMIEPKDGKIRVEFIFCCYPKCHKRGDMEYILDIILSEDEDQNQIVDRCRLPFSFNIQSKLPPKRPRDEAPSASRSRKIQCGVGHQAALQGVRSCEDNRSTSPPTVQSFQLPRNAGCNPAPVSIIGLPDHTTSEDRERAPTLTEVNPDSGSTTGGARIWLKGIDFPALFPLFARFGNAVVPTTFSSSNLLACHLPPSTPGMIYVTLSKQPRSDAPEYGTSVATFKYKGDLDEFITIILRIQGQTPSPLLQALLSVLNNQGNSAPHSSADSYEPVPAQSRAQFGGVFDPILGGSEGIRQPEQLHGGFGQSPTWTFPTNAAGPLTHQSHGPNLGVTFTPFLNQAFNASTSSQQHANQRPLSNAASNYSGASASLHPTEYRYSDTIVNRSPQVRFSGTSKDNQSTTPQRRTNSTGRPPPLATHRASDGVEPLWHSFVPRIYEPINSVNNLRKNSQATVIPVQDHQSTPGPIGITPNMSALNRAASSASRDFSPSGSTFDLAVRHFLHAPEIISKGHLSGLEQGAPPAYETDTEAPLGDNDRMYNDYEASAPEPLAFQSMPDRFVHGNSSSSSQDDSMDDGSTIPKGRDGSAPTYQEMVPDTAPAVVVDMDELSSRSITPPSRARVPWLSKLNDYPLPGSYVAFCAAPDSSSEGHSSLLEHSSDVHYEAEMETFEPLSAPSGAFASPATTEQTFHTTPARHKQRRALLKQGVARMQSASVRQTPVPSSPRPPSVSPSVSPMAVTPSPADPVIARRLGITKRRDNKPQPMQMQLRFDHYPQVIPPPKIEESSDEEATSWRTPGRVNEHIQAPKSHRVLHRRRKTSAGDSSEYRHARPGVCPPLQKRSPSSPHPPRPGEPWARSSSTRAQIGPRPNTIRKRTASGFGHNRQSSRQSEIPSAIAEVASQIGSSLRRVMRGVRSGISEGLKLLSTRGGGTRRIPSNIIMNDFMPLSHARTNGSHSVGLQRSNASKLKRTRYPGSEEPILQHSKPHEADFCSPTSPARQFGPPGNTETSSIPLRPVKEVPLMPLTIFDGPLGSRDLQSGNRGSEMRGDPIETGLVAALTSLQSQPNFPETVSTTNDWGQTLAHLSIVHGYPYLLGHLVDWHINLAIADANGLTALHYAYMKSDLESVRILRRGGASDSVVDKLGRKPSELQSEAFGLAIDMDAKVALG